MSLLDSLFASDTERTDAIDRAIWAIRDHGDSAIDYLKRKLDEASRMKTKRIMRLAIEEVGRRQS
jgi:hypothetical protein